jgi:hypothetical protein
MDETLNPLISEPDRINNNISQLLQRFENIMATATVWFTSFYAPMRQPGVIAESKG